MTDIPFVRCENLIKIYQIADLEVIALQGLNLEVARGEQVALIGPSGVGKSTLLNVLGSLDTPTAGGIWVDGRNLLRMSEQERIQYKRQVVGFAWQQPSRNLLAYLSARENVELPMQHNNIRRPERRRRALALLDMVGLAERAEFLPDRLSGGEQQRVALAVALANHPPLLLGDELTGQLDSDSALQVFEALQVINQTLGTTIVVVTHDPRVAARMDRVVTIRDGRASSEIQHRALEDDGVEDEEWVILDRVGQMQLPRAYVNTLAMQALVKVHLEPDHISVWPQEVDIQPIPVAMPKVPEPTPEPVGGKQIAAQGVTLRTENLTRTFELTAGKVHAVQDINLAIPAGALTVIKGPSGSGKTTLLTLLAGLDDPTAGKVHFGELSLTDMSPQEKTDLRRRQIGYVFQTFGLLPYLSVTENVQVPLRLLRISPQKRTTLVKQVLEQVGLVAREQHRTYELSGGEQQRVAIARALVKRPALILADEPTGQLDSVTGARIIALLKDIIASTGITVVVASHDPTVHERADQLIELVSGSIVEVCINSTGLVD